MFLRCNTRKKDGKTHRYWSIVEDRRLRAGHPKLLRMRSGTENECQQQRQNHAPELPSNPVE
jgi:hypothetical protein